MATITNINATITNITTITAIDNIAASTTTATIAASSYYHYYHRNQWYNAGAGVVLTAVASNTSPSTIWY